MLDIISYNNECLGAVIRKSDNSLMTVKADVTVLATGGIGVFIDIQLISDILQGTRLQLLLSIMLN